jgi:hypothetical protein
MNDQRKLIAHPFILILAFVSFVSSWLIRLSLAARAIA